MSQTGRAQWYWPVVGGRIGQVTTPFGGPQAVTGGYGSVFANKPHDAQGRPLNTGVDVPGRAGTPVVNLTDGTVEEVRVYSPQEEAAGRDSTGGYGNSIVVRLNTGERVRYSHLQQAPPFQKGQAVQGGAQLGTVGDTGNATGPHLDLEMQDAQGAYVDPMVRGGFVAGDPTVALPPGASVGPGGPAGQSGQRGGRISFAGSLPPGAQIGVPFRMGGPAGAAQAAAERILGYASDLPQGVEIGRPVDRNLVAAWRQDMAEPRDGPAYPDSGSAYPDAGSAYPDSGAAYPKEPGAAAAAGAAAAPAPAQAQGGAGLGSPDKNYRDYDRDAVIAEIRRVAREEGHPELAAVLVATAFQETGGNFWPGSVGDGGNSGGVFQENTGGRGAGVPMPSRMSVTESTRRAVREFAAEAQKNPALLGSDPGQLALNAQRPAAEVRPEYKANVNANTKAFQEEGPPGGAPAGAQGVPSPSVGAQGGRTSPKLDQLKAQRQQANTALAQANLDLDRVLDWANRPEQPPASVTDQAEYDAYANAVKTAKAQLPRLQAAQDKAKAEVNRVDQLIGAEETRLDALTEKDDTWKLDSVNGKPVWTNAKGETRPYTGPGSEPTKKVIGGTGASDRYTVVDNGDGTVTYQENKNYTAPRPTQVSGTGPDTEYIGFVNDSGQVTYQKNPGYNPGKAYEHDGRVTLINSKTGQVLSTTDTLPPEERAAARTKTLAEADKLKADAESARIKADLDKKDAEEWQKIEDAVNSGQYTPQQINTLVLTAAKNVTDYANLLKAENERATTLETQRHNLAGEETETRKTRVSEADSAQKATESYGRYGLASAPWQSMLLGAQAPVTDVRQLGAKMGVDEAVSGPVAERYDRQMQQQEEIQNRRRETEREALKPFFAPTQPPGATGALGAGGNGPPGINANPPGTKTPKPGLGAVDLKDQGKPGWARTYYEDGTAEDWRIPDAAPEAAAPAAAPQAAPAESPPPQSEPQPATAGAQYGAQSAGKSDAERQAEFWSKPAQASTAQASPPPPPPSAPSAGDSGSAGAGYMGMPGATDAGFLYGRDDQGASQPEPIPNAPVPPGGFWDGVSPLTPEQQAYIDSQRQNLEGGGGLPQAPQAAPSGIAQRFVGGGGYTRADGSQGWLPPAYLGADPEQPAGGGGGDGAALPQRRRRLPVPGKHATPLQEPGWARTEYDDGAVEEWHVDDGPSWEGIGGRGAGYHGEHPPTYGIGWEEGTGGGGGSIWTLPPTPGATPGLMGPAVAMNAGGPYGGAGLDRPTPPPGGGISGGFAGPAAGGGGDPAQGLPPEAAAAMGGAPPAPAPAGPVEPLTYNGGGQYAGGGGAQGQAGVGGGVPSLFAPGQSGYGAGAGAPGTSSRSSLSGQSNMAGTAPLWDAAMGSGFTPGAPSGTATLFTPKGLGGGAALATTARGGGYYGGPPQPTPNTPLSRLLQQHGVLPSTPGQAAGAPGTV